MSSGPTSIGTQIVKSFQEFSNLFLKAGLHVILFLSFLGVARQHSLHPHVHLSQHLLYSGHPLHADHDDVTTRPSHVPHGHQAEPHILCAPSQCNWHLYSFHILHLSGK